MRKLLGLLGCALLAAGLMAGNAQAQTNPTTTGQLSVASKFVSGFCLEAKDTDSTLYINKCDAQAHQALAIDDNTGQIHQAGKCLAIVVKGQPLALKECADIPDQKWTFNDDGTLKSDSALCADVLNFQRDAGTPVIAWDCNATDNQKFFASNIKLAASAGAAPAAPITVAPVTGQPVIASYFLQGLCLDSRSKKGIITVEVCNRQPAQGFHFASGNSGPIVQDGQCLSSTDKGAELAVQSCNQSSAQDWTFTPDGALRNRANLCADIFKFGTTPGTTVIAWDCTGTDNQKWYPAIAAASGSFSLGKSLAATLRGGGKTTTVSITASYSGYNITGAGGKAITADDNDKITGGQNDTIILGGAGTLTIRFVKGLASPEIKNTIGASLLPKDWSFFSGATAGTIAR